MEGFLTAATFSAALAATTTAPVGTTAAFTSGSATAPAWTGFAGFSAATLHGLHAFGSA
jgi:hypothetical protein